LWFLVSSSWFAQTRIAQRTEIETRNQKLETRNHLFENLKLQKRLADNYLIAILKHVALAGKEPSPSIHERTVGRAQVLDEVLAVVINDARVPSRDFGFGIVFIQIDVRENAAIRVPPADVGLNTHDWKLFADSPAAFDYQPRQSLRRIALLERRADRLERTCSLR